MIPPGVLSFGKLSGMSLDQLHSLFQTVSSIEIISEFLIANALQAFGIPVVFIINGGYFLQKTILHSLVNSHANALL